MKVSYVEGKANLNGPGTNYLVGCEQLSALTAENNPERLLSNSAFVNSRFPVG